MRASVQVKVYLVDEDGEHLMGTGLLRLLTGIERRRSIRRAAQDMDMSYMKAHAILKRMERGLGGPLVTRWHGGAAKGGAELTPFARDLLARYTRHSDRVGALARKEFAPLLKKLRAAKRAP